MRSPDEQQLSTAMKEATANVGFDEVMLARLVRAGRRRQVRIRVAGATLAAGAVAAVGGTAAQVWDRPTDGTATSPGRTLRRRRPSRT